MTANQIAYQANLERERSNRATEALRGAELSELVRANLTKESETNRSNLAREAETNRANVASEKLSLGKLEVQTIMDAISMMLQQRENTMSRISRWLPSIIGGF